MNPMPDGRILIRVEDEPKNPGEWYKLLGDARKDQDFAARWPIYICCPECGKVCSVSTRVHKVEFHEDGTFSASPSFVCPFPPCTWHVHIAHGVTTR